MLIQQMVVVRASETCFADFRWRIQQTNSSQQSIANQSLPTPNRRHSARYPPISSRHVASFSPQSSGTHHQTGDTPPNRGHTTKPGTHHQTGDTPPIGDTPPNPAQLVICSEANETDDSDVESGHADTLIQVHPPGTHHLEATHPKISRVSTLGINHYGLGDTPHFTTRLPHRNESTQLRGPAITGDTPPRIAQLVVCRESDESDDFAFISCPASILILDQHVGTITSETHH